MNPEVDAFFGKAKQWHKELEQLRRIVLDCGLIEELKWRVPCYTIPVGGKGSNVVLIHGFKEYCALNFFKGALLQDAEGILVQQTENVQSGRQIRFSTLDEIVEQEATLKAYIYEAVEVERAGLKVAPRKKEPLDLPEEFENKLKNNAALKEAFEALTPGRQRAYNLYFSAAKQSKTRETRVDKYTQRILNGFGLNDCVCGLSKRMPNCDGSHKQAK
ncbi:DUF1801 domain-containing protein [Reichenbachiella sp. MSK19-1]|uniref:DUF1801 domain-containing protein n=1 Tax=Reichenbachiella sp. MSK19-1 TaxID=1897631 RepID=UPI000E6BED99|nr:DUF1801 domain-containing protein [Reichenbachiella sp. MSK19-1]RJE74757.1 hypothetical protein BGP76_16625 [Reichenbachiella sp. MSK19-1]